MKELVIATFNPKKGNEMRVILGKLLQDTRLLTLNEFPNAEEPEETGTTYSENATIKAVAAAKVTQLPSLADDAGLEIDFLNGAPGVYSKRFGGEDLPFPEKISRILDLMNGVPENERTCRFQCFIAFDAPNCAVPMLFSATCEGQIALNPSGSRGFGYDPIFYLPDQKRNMADLTPEEKEQISHRGKVLRQFAKFWNSRENLPTRGYE